MDGKQKKVIVDICGDTINRNPTKEELKDLKKELPKRELYNNKEYLLEFLRHFDKKEGRAPKQSDFNKNSKCPSYVSYRSWFGSWSDAIKDAGLLAKTEIVRRRLYKDEELLKSLRGFEREEGRIPRQEDFINNPKYPGFSIYQKYFGSWNNTLKLSGLRINVFTNCTDEELLEFLTKFEIEEERIPRQEDFVNNPSCPSPKLYRDLFVSFENAKRLVGIDIDSIIRKGTIKNVREKGKQAELYVLENYER